MFVNIYYRGFLFFIHLIIFSSANISIYKTSVNLTTLQLVQIIARHGDRAPIYPYPNDLYRNSSVYSNNGWGELSEIGAKQVYELGTYLRQRYDGFLPRKYHKRDFLMLSSDIDRAIMSAEANLAGLYELGPVPRSQNIFKEWQPVPIHTIPQDEDNLINGKAHCSRYLSLYKQFFDSDEFKNFLKENQAFIDFIEAMSGQTSIRRDFEEIFRVQDVLQCQLLHNLTLPSWVNSTVYEKLEYFKTLSFVWNTRTDEMKRLKIGPLFERLVEEMRGKVESPNLILNDDDFDDRNKDSEIIPYQDPLRLRKMYIYSGHDSTISAILDSLNLFQPLHIPPYASALIIELHKIPGKGDYFVEFFYKNDTTRNPYKLDTTAFCNKTYCSYEDFARFVQKFIPADWKNECQYQASSHKLMRTAPADAFHSEGRFDGDNQSYMITRHLPGIRIMAGPSTFVLALISVMSLLLTSAAILLAILRLKPKVTRPRLHSVYESLS